MKCFIISLFVLISSAAPAQTPYTYTYDGGSVILNGSFSKYILQNDTAFNWYNFSRNNYDPQPNVVARLAESAKKFKFIIFGGTWCEDTQNILPKFFVLQEKAGIPDENIALYGVDRSKHMIDNLASVMEITNVPTIIVLKNGVEVGRVVEYGPTGKWEDALLDLVK